MPYETTQVTQPTDPNKGCPLNPRRQHLTKETSTDLWVTSKPLFRYLQVQTSPHVLRIYLNYLLEALAPLLIICNPWLSKLTCLLTGTALFAAALQ